MPYANQESSSALVHKVEMHKLNEAFEVKAATAVKAGQLVKLVAADGTIEPAASGESNLNVIGTAVMDGAAGEIITVRMKASSIVKCVADGSVTAGAVKTTGLSTGNLNKVSSATVTDANYIGWALSAQDDTEEIYVALP